MTIDIRRLKNQDAPLMLEWMHDPQIQKSFKKNMLSMTISDANLFINKYKEQKVGEDNLHFAIVNENDEYLGTISLKNIDYIHRNAEMAIVIRKDFSGSGVGRESIQKIMDYSKEILHLHKLYLNVISTNSRAIHLYEKSGFIQEGVFKEQLIIEGEYVDLIWYGLRLER